MKKQILSEEFKRMQKLAGIITEGELLEIPNISDTAIEQLNNWLTSNIKSTWEIKVANNNLTIDISKIPTEDLDKITNYLSSENYIKEFTVRNI